MYKLNFSTLAKQDIKDARYWYRKKQQVLDKRFYKELKDTLKRITQNPLSFPAKHAEIRIAHILVFPYLIHFSIDDEQKYINIFGIYHAKDNPKKWDRWPNE